MNSTSDPSWRERLSSEWSAVRRTCATLDYQTAVVLTVAAIAVIFQMKWGSRSFFRSIISPNLNIGATGLTAWGWWFISQGIWGFLVPVIILRLGFRRKWEEMGLGLGDWKFASVVAGLYVPIVLIGTWVLSASPDFQAQYPHLAEAKTDWSVFFIYESLFVFYWIGWEYLWRGFVLFGTAHRFGIYAILIQALPFAILHYQKPLPEAMLSIVGGIALGALVWRTRSFWIAVPIHALQMFSLDLLSTIRFRTGISDIGPEAFWELLQRIF